jgi:asparagine synthase (glutamine-hydrolysing)
MCGFAGVLSERRTLAEDRLLQAMGNTLVHRGPDDQGTWSDSYQTIGLAHRRLSVVDLSAAGHQPMFSSSGRYVIAYNGEIYNHLDLRARYDRRGGINWRGRSDTETLLCGFDIDGVDATLKAAIGMFAFALWDFDEKTLTLARDRLGEKPLYYGWQGRGDNRAFLFGSDLSAIRVHPSFEFKEDPTALCEFLRYGYIPAPYSIYSGVRKLGAGEILRISLKYPVPKIASYWNSEDLVKNKPGFKGSAIEAVDHLEKLTKTAVKRQMMSDVPFGAFLSGGVDSSTVVALAQAQSDHPIKTFTIGFADEDHNEAVYASAVAKHLRTDHHELYVTAQMAQSIIPKLPAVYSEPFADSSQIPVYLVSAMARSSVTVALSGDGGDELFAGYNRYVVADKYFRRLQPLPHAFRCLIADSLGRVTATNWTRIQNLVGKKRTFANLSEKIPKIQRALRAKTPSDQYLGLTSLNFNPELLLHTELRASLGDKAPRERALTSDGFISEMMALDLLTYLPDDILCKVDRAAMAVSLETRVPLLDHQLVEFALSLPLSMKLRAGVGKWPLRQLLYRHVPKELIERPKMGFSIPIDNWLRGALHDWAAHLIHQSHEDGIDANAIKLMWAQHVSGTDNFGNSLWPVLMYRAWRETQRA